MCRIKSKAKRKDHLIKEEDLYLVRETRIGEIDHNQYGSKDKSSKISHIVSKEVSLEQGVRDRKQQIKVDSSV